MAWVKAIAIVLTALLALLALLALAAGQLGWLRGPAPSRLGLIEGRPKPPSRTPNSVSSQADLWPDHPLRDHARIAPFAAGAAAGGPDANWARLRRVLEADRRARIVRADGDYLHAEFTTRWLGFVDDTEFWLDRAAGVIHVRSSSRVGRRDYGANRARVESLRARLGAPGGAAGG